MRRISKMSPEDKLMCAIYGKPLSDVTDADVARLRKKYPKLMAKIDADPSATLTDIGRRPKLPTYHPGWFPNLHEMPGMIKDSALVAARSEPSPSM